MQVRTRFAPSPTGLVHIGSIRTALFSWLFAKKHGGKFILRVEDTDQERLVPGAIKAIFDAFNWFKIDVDEGPSIEELSQVGEIGSGAPGTGGPFGPYIQSLRHARYMEISEELVRIGAAYRCDCTPEQLEQDRAEQQAMKIPPGYNGRCRNRNVSPQSKHVVRLRMPDNLSLTHDDAVKGQVSWEGTPLKDMVLMKSSGLPTYHLALVVDDHDMQITHAFRGEEWLSTTPIHLLIYKALGWQPPVIGHLPAVLGTDGKKLSKRTGSTFVVNFADDGYLPEALMNYVALVGWSPGSGSEQEIFSRSELIQAFSIEQISKSPGVFDYNKLLWMNGIYIRGLALEDFIQRTLPFLLRKGLNVDLQKYMMIAPHLVERIKVLSDVPELVDFLFVDTIQRDLPAMLKKGVDKDCANRILERAAGCVDNLATFDTGSLDVALRELSNELALKPTIVFGVLRIAITGKSVTPPLFESMVALGKEVVLKRLREAQDDLTRI